MIYQLPNPIDVSTPLGDCTALFIIDYGIDTNTVWLCRMSGGSVKHFLSDDIKVYGNPMYGNGWDISGKPTNRWGKGAKRNMDFIKKANN